MLPSFTGFCMDLLGFTGFYWVSLRWFDSSRRDRPLDWSARIHQSFFFCFFCLILCVCVCVCVCVLSRRAEAFFFVVRFSFGRRLSNFDFLFHWFYFFWSVGKNRWKTKWNVILGLQSGGMSGSNSSSSGSTPSYNSATSLVASNRWEPNNEAHLPSSNRNPA